MGQPHIKHKIAAHKVGGNFKVLFFGKRKRLFSIGIDQFGDNGVQLFYNRRNVRNAVAYDLGALVHGVHCFVGAGNSRLGFVYLVHYSGGSGLYTADVGEYLIGVLLRFFKGVGGFDRKISYLTGNYREALSVLARSRRLNRRVNGENVGLLGNVLDFKQYLVVFVQTYAYLGYGINDLARPGVNIYHICIKRAHVLFDIGILDGIIRCRSRYGLYSFIKHG